MTGVQTCALPIYFLLSLKQRGLDIAEAMSVAQENEALKQESCLFHLVILRVYMCVRMQMKQPRSAREERRLEEIAVTMGVAQGNEAHKQENCLFRLLVILCVSMCVRMQMKQPRSAREERGLQEIAEAMGVAQENEAHKHDHFILPGCFVHACR